MKALSLITSYVSLNRAQCKSKTVGMASKYRYGDAKANKSMHMHMHMLPYQQKGKYLCALKQPTSIVEMHSDGIGIVNFLQGKTLLLTGGTGFLGKVLLEKILRTAPDIHKIFVLIKAKDKDDAVERLKNEIIYTELFEHLKQSHGESYEAFMLSKLDPLVGNLCESDLGLDEDTIALMAKKVDVIVNSAANTTFDERYDIAMDMNVGGPTRLMDIAKLCRKLRVFLQVSTAYVNGERQGRIKEKQFYMGESINLNEKQPKLNIEDEMRLILESKEAIQEDHNTLFKELKELAKQRAKRFGWQDAYVFTKAMGEMTIESLRGHTFPVVIMRPSIICSTYTQPFPGWIQGNRMMDPMIQHYGKGHLPVFLCDPNAVLDVIPVDMVVNAMLAAMAKHGAAGKPESNIYQVASSVANPFYIRDMFEFLYGYFDSSPLVDSKGSPIRVAPIEFCCSMEDFSSKLQGHFTSRGGGMMSEIRCRKLVGQIKHLAKVYEPYAFYGGRFDSSNTKTLMGYMSKEERQQFGFDIESLDWEDYIKEIHIPGSRKYVMKEK